MAMGYALRSGLGGGGALLGLLGLGRLGNGGSEHEAAVVDRRIDIAQVQQAVGFGLLRVFDVDGGFACVHLDGFEVGINGHNAHFGLFALQHRLDDAIEQELELLGGLGGMLTVPPTTNWLAFGQSVALLPAS
jgi:hypothetical protein